MGSLFLELFPIAFFWALSPVIIAIVILLLSQENGVRKALAFTVPSVVGSMVIGAVLVLAFNGSDYSKGSSASTLTYIAQLCAGVFFLLAAFVAWWKLPKSSAEMKMPKWVEYLDRVTPRSALVYGSILFVNNVILTISAVTNILRAQVTAARGVITVIVFVIIGTLGLWIPVSYRLLSPERSVEGIESARQWLIRNYRMLLILEFIFLAVIELANAIYGLVQ